MKKLETAKAHNEQITGSYESLTRESGFPMPLPLIKKDPLERMADSLEEIGKKLSHIEDWLGELVNELRKRNQRTP